MGEFLDGRKDILKHGHKLPHWQQGEVMQFATFRLGDAMPQSKVRIWKEERAAWMAMHPEPWDEPTRMEYYRRFTDRLERWLDQGYGSCLFKKAENRRILEAVLMFDREKQAQQHAWVIMPNHVHALFTPKMPLPKLLKTWKGISAREIGRGSIWQRNYRDTMIRDADHFGNVVRYIRRNPAKLPEGTFLLWESERAKAVV